MIIFQSTWPQLDISSCSCQSYSLIALILLYLAAFVPSLMLTRLILKKLKRIKVKSNNIYKNAGMQTPDHELAIQNLVGTS